MLKLAKILVQIDTPFWHKLKLNAKANICNVVIDCCEFDGSNRFEISCECCVTLQIHLFGSLHR